MIYNMQYRLITDTTSVLYEVTYVLWCDQMLINRYAKPLDKI